MLLKGPRFSRGVLGGHQLFPLQYAVSVNDGNRLFAVSRNNGAGEDVFNPPFPIPAHFETWIRQVNPLVKSHRIKQNRNIKGVKYMPGLLLTAAFDASGDSAKGK